MQDEQCRNRSKQLANPHKSRKTGAKKRSRKKEEKKQKVEGA
jgi:hypothetical protein